MSWITICNANKVLLSDLASFPQQKILSKNSRMTRALNGILQSVLNAIDAGKSSAETTLQQYSLHPKYTNRVAALVHRLWGFTVHANGVDRYSTSAKDGDYPVSKVRAKLHITWTHADVPKFDFTVFQQFRDQFIDITLVSGGAKFGAHKLLLAARSEMMKALLTGRFKEANTHEVPFNVAPETFGSFLDVLYGGQCLLSGKSIDFIEQLFELATYFIVPDIKVACWSALAQLISEQTAARITEIARRLDCKELLGICSWKSTEEKIQSPCPYIKDFTVADKPIEELAVILQLNQFLQNPKVHRECVVALRNLSCEETIERVQSIAQKYGLSELLVEEMDTNE
ncbi:MAG: BTB/POZ domain-containing protein [Verrucomicrobia bacterium]|nr:BTB/POZ domain-containing protein [Verrucomicrobiota bacterium]MBS0637006.1 BTB/POZ domain-containing protein [Verrucomicrobiota bacterium]